MTVHVVVPEGIDDPARPSGGNVYDRQVCRALAARGWTVQEHEVAGAWPNPGAVGHAALAGVAASVPDGATVLLDGLVASAAPEVLAAHADRVRQVVLVHMPLGHRPASDVAETVRQREGDALRAAAAVVTTSEWSRRRLVELYGPALGRARVAHPGVEAAAVAPQRPAGDALLCVAAVTSDKGHDVLVEALGLVADLPWSCTCVGSLDRDRAFADRVRRLVRDRGLGERVRFTGPCTGAPLERAYAGADLLVLASHAETYGMVVTEALARGIPALATEVGGVPEALGTGSDGTRPGFLVAPGDAAALAAALRAWLRDGGLRARLRRAAAQRRRQLTGWPVTASTIADVVAGAAR